MPKNMTTNAEEKLTGYLSEKNIFRIVRYYDEKDDHKFTFLTHAKQHYVLDVVNLYKKDGRLSCSLNSPSYILK